MDYNKIINAAPVVLVEFFASWCPHCQRMMPVVADIKAKLQGKADVAQFDIDRESQLADAENIETIPTFIIYKDGKEQWRHSGELSEAQLLDAITSHL